MLSSWSTWVGACVALVGNVVINLGTNLVVVYHSTSEPVEDYESQNASRNLRVWRTGVACFVLGNCLNFVSMSFAAQSLLAALGSVQFISHVTFQWLVHGRPVSGRMCVATFLIFVGNSVIVAFGDHSGHVWTAHELEHMLLRRGFLLYLIVLTSVVAVAWVLNYHANTAALTRNEHDNLRFLHRIGPLCHTVVSAGVGSQSVTLAKCVSLLLRKTVEGSNQLLHPVTHVLLFLWALTMAFWIHRLNMSLRKYDSAFIVPVLQVMWTFFSVLGGGVYFGEFSSFHLSQSILFSSGLCCVFVGVATLSDQQSRQQRVSNESENIGTAKSNASAPSSWLSLSPRSIANGLEVEVIATGDSPLLHPCPASSVEDHQSSAHGEHSDASELDQLEQEEMGLLVQHIGETEGHVDCSQKLPDLEPHVPQRGTFCDPEEV